MSCFERMVSGHVTLELERPVPLITSDPDLAWRVISAEVEVSSGTVAGATLAGSMTPVVLTAREERRAIERVEDQYDPDDHYADDAFAESRCERRRELWEALSQ